MYLGSKQILASAILALLAMSCKRDRVCYCKSNDPSLEDKKIVLHNTKGDAKEDCDREAEFWAPDWTCTFQN
jgi:hypothetical protein